MCAYSRLVSARALHAWLSLCLLLILPSAAPAQPLLFRGTVTDESGAPVSWGGVGFSNIAGLWPVQDGRFQLQIDNVPPGDYWVAYSKRDGRSRLVNRPVHIAQGQDEVAVDFRIGEQPVLEARVVTDGMPRGVPNASVSLRGVRPDGQPYEGGIYASDDGSFILDGFVFEGCRLQARVPYHHPSEWLEIEPPFPMKADLRCPPDTVILGRVVELTATPVPSAQVLAATKGRRSKVIADEYGRFELTDLDPGAYRIEAHGPYLMGSGATVHLEEGKQVLGLAIRLDHAVRQTIHGRVLAPDGTTGIAGAAISLEQTFFPPPAPGEPARLANRGGAVARVTYATTTEADGSYHLDVPAQPGVADDRRRFDGMVRADGYLPRRYFVFVDRDRDGPYDFQLFRGGHLSGTLRFADASLPPRDTIVEIQVATGLVGAPDGTSGYSCPQSPVSPDTGRFDLGLVQPGEHWLLVRIRGRERLTEKIIVEEGKARDIDVLCPATSGP